MTANHKQDKPPNAQRTCAPLDYMCMGSFYVHVSISCVSFPLFRINKVCISFLRMQKRDKQEQAGGVLHPPPLPPGGL